MSSIERETIEKLQAALVAAQAKLQEQQDFINEVSSPPLSFATIIEPGPKTTVIASGGGILLVNTPTRFKVQPGDFVTVAPTSQIVEKHPFAPMGGITSVRKVLVDGLIEIGGGEGGEGSLAYAGLFKGKIEVGDRIQLDQSRMVVIRNLGQQIETFQFNGNTGVDWNDIGGLDAAKLQMQEAIEHPIKHAHLYQAYKKKPIKGVLLYGPPGCGKTMLAKAAATSIAKLHGKKGVDTGFIYVKGPEILQRFVGVSEEIIRALFARAKKHKEKHGYPAFMFIDEADAILRKRGSGISSDMESTIVPAFLAEMDGLAETGCIVGLATNRPDTLDNAVTRDGRVDRKVRVPRPDAKTAQEIFKLHLRGVPLVDATPSEIAKKCTESLFSSDRQLYIAKMKDGQKHSFNLSMLVNGAMIAGIVDQASSLAMQRNILGSRKQGVGMEDVHAAIDMAYQENIDLNHQDELTDFIDPIKDGIENFEKLRRLVTA